MTAVSAEIREASPFAGGNTVNIGAERPTAPKRFDTLPIEKPKTAETRQRNVAKAITELNKGTD